MSRYQAVYAQWQADPNGFWAQAAEGVSWSRPFDTVFDGSQGPYGRWFAGGELNTSFNCLDRHIAAGRGHQAAIIYDSPVTGTKRTFSYNEALARVEAIAGVLLDQGVTKGDRVIIYMPMIPQALFAMLACARIGAVHSVVFGGFAAAELATRIDDAKPRVVISASCGIEGKKVIAYKPLLDHAIELAAHKPISVLVFQRSHAKAELQHGRDFDLSELTLEGLEAKRHIAPVPVKATDPLYILYTSGTTGQPKGVVRDNGGHAVALTWTMGAIYDVKPGEVFWSASDVGWVVGHSYIVYAPLLIGATTVVYEGKPVGTPDSGAFWRVIAEHKVTALFTAPTALRAIRKEDPQGRMIGLSDLSSLRTLFLAGERADPDTVQWAEEKLRIPVIDNWWQTETGWPIAANPKGLGLLPVKRGSPAVPMPGHDVQVLDDAGHAVPAGTLGNIVIKLPLPPGCLPTLWEHDERFRSSYLTEFPGYYKTSDAGVIDADGYVSILSRTDDIINVAGHRLSTGGMEEALSGHPDVAECAVVGIADALKGQAPCGFVVLKSGVTRDPHLIEAELVARVRELIGPVAAFKLVVTVDRLPKTRSGKILRGTMRQIVDGEAYRMPATIDDPAVLAEIEAIVEGRRIGQVA